MWKLGWGNCTWQAIVIAVAALPAARLAGDESRIENIDSWQQQCQLRLRPTSKEQQQAANVEVHGALDALRKQLDRMPNGVALAKEMNLKELSQQLASESYDAAVLSRARSWVNATSGRRAGRPGHADLRMRHRRARAPRSSASCGARPVGCLTVGMAVDRAQCPSSSASRPGRVDRFLHAHGSVPVRPQGTAVAVDGVVMLLAADQKLVDGDHGLACREPRDPVVGVTERDVEADGRGGDFGGRD